MLRTDLSRKEPSKKQFKTPERVKHNESNMPRLVNSSSTRASSTGSRRPRHLHQPEPEGPRACSWSRSSTLSLCTEGLHISQPDYLLFRVQIPDSVTQLGLMHSLHELPCPSWTKPGYRLDNSRQACILRCQDCNKAALSHHASLLSFLTASLSDPVRS